MFAKTLSTWQCLRPPMLASGCGARADFRRRGQDRRSHRHERPGLDADRPGLGDRGPNGGRRFRRQGVGQADLGGTSAIIS